MLSKNYEINDKDFQNRLPELALNQFSKKNLLKMIIFVIVTFITMFLFGFFLGQSRNPLNQLTGHLIAEITILFWAFISYIIINFLIYFTRRIKYQLGLPRLGLYLLTNLAFIVPIICFKKGLFGNIENGHFDAIAVQNAIKTLIYILVSLFSLIIAINFGFVFFMRKKHVHSFYKFVFICLPIIVIIVSPFSLLKSINANCRFEKEVLFIALSLVALSLFGVLFSMVARYHSEGSSNLKYINRVYFPLISLLVSGCVLGVALSHLFDNNYQNGSTIEFNFFAILSLIISFILFLGFLFYIWIVNKKNHRNSFLNKLVLKAFIIINIFVGMILIYLLPKGSNQNIFLTSLLVVISPLLIISTGTFLAVLFKFVTFERWEVISIIGNVLILMIIITLNGVFYTLEEIKILYGWLGRALWLIFLFLYVIVEMFIFLPELFIIVRIRKNSSNMIREKGDKHV